MVKIMKMVESLEESGLLIKNIVCFQVKDNNRW